MTWNSIISDPAVGNFLALLVFFGFCKLYEKCSPAATSERQKYKPSLIISNGETKRKVDVK